MLCFCDFLNVPTVGQIKEYQIQSNQINDAAEKLLREMSLW